MPGGAIAKFASLLASNSRVWRSFMIERTSTALCSGVSTLSVCGRTSPSILIAGGKPLVMNRSDPLRSTMRRSRSCISLIACSRSIPCLPGATRRLDRFLVGRLVARLFLGHQPLGQHVREALVERLHALRLASLDRRVHLRDLVLADQVPDRGRRDHDFVGGDAAAAEALHQRL